MNSEANSITVQIKYKDLEKTFSGNMEEVWLSVNKLFMEFIPSLDIAQRLMLKVDLQKLAKDCQDIIALSKEGPTILAPRNRLTDNETLSLWLLAYYMGNQLGMLKSDAVSKEELQAKLGKNAKITSTRIGELLKNETAAKTADEKYKITIFGVFQIQKETLPRIRAKMGD